MDTEQANKYAVVLLPDEVPVLISVSRKRAVLITTRGLSGHREIIFPAPVAPPEIEKMDAMYAEASAERGAQIEAELQTAREQIATLNGRVLGLEARVGRLQGERRIIRALAKALWGIVKNDA